MQDLLIKENEEFIITEDDNTNLNDLEIDEVHDNKVIRIF